MSAILNNGLSIRSLSASDSLDEQLSLHEYTLLFFSASWCAPCRSMTSIVIEVASMMNGRFSTIKIDVDELPKYGYEFGIRGVPTLILTQNGEIIDQCVGEISKPQFEQWISLLT